MGGIEEYSEIDSFPRLPGAVSSHLRCTDHRRGMSEDRERERERGGIEREREKEKRGGR